MSNTLASLRRAIDGARDLQSVVSAMKALAAASIGQYERANESLRDYDRAVEWALSLCMQRTGTGSFQPSVGATGEPRRGWIVFGSDQGLVGRFNEVLAEFALGTTNGASGRPDQVWVVGERMMSLLSDQGLSSLDHLPAPRSVGGITALVGQILIAVEAARTRYPTIDIEIFHNQPLARAAYRPVHQRLIPFDAAWRTARLAARWPTKSVPELLGPPDATLRVLVREFLFVLLFRACAESLASENASRLDAMRRAERNIEDILDDLERRSHRVRQVAIDEELFDVISGYNAH